MNYIKISVFEMYRSQLFDDLMASYNAISEMLNTEMVMPFTVDPEITEIAGADGKTTQSLTLNAKSPLEDLGNNINEAFDNGDIVTIDFSSPVGEPIYLPIPSTVEEEYSQRYDISSFNLGALVSSAITDKLIQKVGIVSPGAASIVTDVKSLTQLLLQRANIAIDPNTLMTYAGSNPRSLTLNININPRSATEHQKYSKYVNLLREYSKATKKRLELAESVNLGYLDQKHIFTIEFVSIDNNTETLLEYMTDILGFSHNVCKGFLLIDILVSSGDANGTTLYEDGTPKTIDLSLTFQERTPLFRHNFDINEKYINEKYSMVNGSISGSTNGSAKGYVEEKPVNVQTSDSDLKNNYEKQEENKDKPATSTAVTPIKQTPDEGGYIINGEGEYVLAE